MPEVNKTTVLKKVLRKSYSVDANLLSKNGPTKKPLGQPRKPLKSSGDEEPKKTIKARSKSVKGTEPFFSFP